MRKPLPDPIQWGQLAGLFTDDPEDSLPSVTIQGPGAFLYARFDNPGLRLNWLKELRGSTDRAIRRLESRR